MHGEGKQVFISRGVKDDLDTKRKACNDCGGRFFRVFHGTGRLFFLSNKPVPGAVATNPAEADAEMVRALEDIRSYPDAKRQRPVDASTEWKLPAEDRPAKYRKLGSLRRRPADALETAAARGLGTEVVEVASLVAYQGYYYPKDITPEEKTMIRRDIANGPVEHETGDGPNETAEEELYLSRA
jgi:hypothetical protein